MTPEDTPHMTTTISYADMYTQLSAREWERAVAADKAKVASGLLPPLGTPLLAPRGLSLDERDLLGHIVRWGSDGYPIVKYNPHKWTWRYRGINAPMVWRTRREAVAGFETYHAVLRAEVAR